MRALVIDEEVKTQIAAVKTYAEENRRGSKLMERVAKGKSLAAGDIPGHVMQVPVGFKVVYSIEALGPYGWVHRLSASVDSNADVCPHPAAMDTIIHAFGMGDGLHQMDVVTIESLPDGGRAICVSQLLDRRFAELEETKGKLPSKEAREVALKRCGMFFESIHDLNRENP